MGHLGISVSHPIQSAFILRNLVPNIVSSQRVFLLVRPNMSVLHLNILLNILRINELSLLQRKSVCLSQSQCQHLIRLEKIPPSQQQEYLRLMSNGNSEALVLSGIAAKAIMMTLMQSTNQLYP